MWHTPRTQFAFYRSRLSGKKTKGRLKNPRNRFFRRPLVRQKPRASSWDDTPCNGFGIA